jgi:phosphoadenosine phosphosulfate reductase
MTPAPSPPDAAALEGRSPQEILEAAVAAHDRVRLSFSGAEDVVLIDMAAGMGLPVSVFTLDTGRLPPETLAYVEEVREHYGYDIEVAFPDTAAVQDLVRRKGLFSFREDGHEECCAIRKVEPLRRMLAGTDAWITGQRRDQSPTRAHLPVCQLDPAGDGTRWKYNPLAAWTRRDVWAYLIEQEVLINPLHRQGYVSLGCAPCTRPVLPGEHERAGRWWWEEATQRECGLHVAREPSR